MVHYIKDNNFDFPKAPPPSSSPHFESFDMNLLPSSPPPPEPAAEPSKRIRKSTAKRRMALEDALLEGPGPIDTRPEPEPPRSVSPVRNKCVPIIPPNDAKELGWGSGDQKLQDKFNEGK